MDLRKVSKDPRIIYLITFILLGVPVLYPIGIPIPISDITRDVYNFIETLPEGSVVVIGIDYGAVSVPELQPQSEALLEHALMKNFKILFISLWNFEAPIYIERTMKAVGMDDYEYGIDYVNLGYFPGEGRAMSSFAEDIHQLAKYDYYGTPIEQLQMMNDITSAHDLNAYLSIAGSGHGQFINMIQTPYNVPWIFGSEAVAATGLIPYIASGQAEGIIIGPRGAAEYEAIIGAIGSATAQMDVQSLVHLMIIIAVILGNISYLMNKGEN